MKTAAAIIRPVIHPTTTDTVLLLMRDGGTLCRQCTTENARLIIQATRERDGSGWDAETPYLHAEGSPISCDHCNVPQASDYGLTYTAYLADVATPDYWGGHHAPYASTPVDATTTPEEIIEGIRSELNAGAIAGSYNPETLDVSDLLDALPDLQRRLEQNSPTDWARAMPDHITDPDDCDIHAQAYVIFLEG